MLMNDQGELDFDFRARIIVDPKILHGKAAIKGTRIPVSLVLNLLAHDYSFERVIEAYPILTEGDIRAATLYASARLEHEEDRYLAG
jgi:uncharacterized protein (DUF433 family)